MEEYFITVFAFLIVLIISALPLHFAVKILGGRTHLLKTILVMIVTSIMIVLVSLLLPYGAIIGFIVLIWMYREMFRLKWYKALLVWILQIIFVVILLLILSFVGVTLTLMAITNSIFMI